MFLHGISLQGYRSFGPEMQRIGPLSKLNLFIGENNSGKSNILRFLQMHLHQLITGNIASSIVAKDDFHRGGAREITFGLGVPRNAEHWSKLLNAKADSSLIRMALQILEMPQFNHGTDLAWFDCHWTSEPNSISRLPNYEDFRGRPHNERWRDFLQQASNRSSNSVEEQVKQSLELLWRPVWNQQRIPRVTYIPAFRQVGGNQLGEGIFSGHGLVQELATFHRPDAHESHKKLVFKKIENFLRLVTGVVDAELEIPHRNDLINVTMHGRTLPLDALGTGIHQVVILAAAATLLEDQLICLEEPEIYLHPILQRKLLDYLVASTSNQYIVSTHSAHILDTPGANVFHLELVDGQTNCKAAITSLDKWRICDALGYRASDILQANCVIWVEGPSDVYYRKRPLNCIL